MYIWNEKETKDNGKNPGKGKLVACGTDAEGAFKRLHLFLREKNSAPNKYLLTGKILPCRSLA